MRAALACRLDQNSDNAYAKHAVAALYPIAGGALGGMKVRPMFVCANEPQASLVHAAQGCAGWQGMGAVHHCRPVHQLPPHSCAAVFCPTAVQPAHVSLLHVARQMAAAPQVDAPEKWLFWWVAMDCSCRWSHWPAAVAAGACVAATAAAAASTAAAACHSHALPTHALSAATPLIGRGGAGQFVDLLSKVGQGSKLG